MPGCGVPLKRVLRDELARTSNRQRLLQFARCWLYEHRLIVLRERELRTMIVKAIRTHEAGLARMIVAAVDPQLLENGGQSYCPQETAQAGEAQTTAACSLIRRSSRTSRMAQSILASTELSASMELDSSSSGQRVRECVDGRVRHTVARGMHYPRFRKCLS